MRKLQRINSIVSFLFVFSLVLQAASCAGKRAPEVTVVSAGAGILETATALQKAVTAATDAGTLPVPLARKLTGYNEQVLAAATKARVALESYHTATTVDLRRVKASEIQAHLGDINAALGKFLGEALPEGTVRQLTVLVGNVMATVSSVQSVVAQGLGR